MLVGLAHIIHMIPLDGKAPTVTWTVLAPANTYSPSTSYVGLVPQLTYPMPYFFTQGLKPEKWLEGNYH
jgi:hypothetical protein